MFIHVTVVTGKIAAAMDLQHILRDRPRHVICSDSRIERRDADSRWILPETNDLAHHLADIFVIEQLIEWNGTKIGDSGELRSAQIGRICDIFHDRFLPGRARSSTGSLQD
jgi:hypothetical protein